MVCSWVGGRGDSAGVTDYVFRKVSPLHPSTTGEQSCLCAQKSWKVQPTFSNRFIEILEKKCVYTTIKPLIALEQKKVTFNYVIFRSIDLARPLTQQRLLGCHVAQRLNLSHYLETLSGLYIFCVLHSADKYDVPYVASWQGGGEMTGTSWQHSWCMTSYPLTSCQSLSS